MLLAEELWGSDPSPFHVLVSALVTGPLDQARLRAAIQLVTDRNSTLRTVFARDPRTGNLGRRVLPEWTVELVEQDLPGEPAEGDEVARVHARLATVASRLLRPFERPPAVFVLTPASPQRAVVSVLAHHALLDGWSIGLLWQRIAAAYRLPEGGAVDVPDWPGMEAVVERERSPRVAPLVARRAAMLADWPGVIELPSDQERPAIHATTGTRLPFTPDPRAVAGCEKLAEQCGVGRNAVLLAAWALVLARRTAMDRFILGVPAFNRGNAAAMQVIGGCAGIAPVACRVPREGTVEDFVQQTAAALRLALGFGDVPFEELVARLPWSADLSREPLVQVGFGAHDELVPATLPADEVSFDVRIGHVGGCAYDAMLHVFRWKPEPLIELEYGDAVLTAAEARQLAESFDWALAEMAEAPLGPLAAVTTVSAAQSGRLRELAEGPAAEVGEGLWQLFERVVAEQPDAVAVRDGGPGRTLSYAELAAAAAAESARLADAGIREGDRVGLALARGATEIVSVLAVLRIGAAYVGIDQNAPAAATSEMLDRAGVRVLLGTAASLERTGQAKSGRTILAAGDPWRLEDRPVPLPAAADPERIAYVGFTSGTTGPAKGAMIACRGIVRLAHRPRFLRPGATARFLRLAPLAFDASTLEIFAPLLSGGTVEVLAAEHPTPNALAAFLRDRRVTGLWLTAGLFRLAADFRPDAFAGVEQLITGGDVVPPMQAAQVLRACPGLRITNGYGPTENTTFTTVYHLDHADQAAVAALPVGRPIQGTGVLVLDEMGRPVPPGGIGELYTYGEGVATGYIGMPEESARAFGRFARGDARRLYRTGDLVRWDAEGNLRYLGRRDRQVKIRGFRVEPEHVGQVLRGHPAVSDATVLVVPLNRGEKQLLAAVRPIEGQPLEQGELQSYAAQRLPGYAVPSIWALVDQLPVTRNGKIDAARLAIAGVQVPARPRRT
jgi:amino acid adenylation domain-containing protein